eukprot:758080-Hanusia_phi.AAC.2
MASVLSGALEFLVSLALRLSEASLATYRRSSSCAPLALTSWYTQVGGAKNSPATVFAVEVDENGGIVVDTSKTGKSGVAA